VQTLEEEVEDCGIPEEFIRAPKCSARDAAGQVPRTPGYYAIFIDDPCALPSPFQDLLIQRGTKLLYIGIATVSLYDRLVKQDLRSEGHSAFFRGIGCIRCRRPERGSLVGKKNQNNYTFSPPDKAKIIEWINQHLSVNWIKAKPALKSIEKCLIRKYCPIINTMHNPSRVQKLAELRRECRMIARAPK
jgi:hypothetical protein